MERRRRQLKFVPISDELEPIQLLSTLLPGTKTTTATTTSLNTLAQKQQRIERLPYYLNQIYPGLTIPTSVTAPLQADLNSIIGRLTPPGTNNLSAFNVELRKGQGTASISRQAAQTLNAAFGSVLTSAKATSTEVASLQADMQALTKYNVGTPAPGFITTNVYSTVLQTALGVGKPYSLTNVGVGKPVAKGNGSFTTAISIQVASNVFVNPTVAYPTPTGSVELHQIVISPVAGKTSQTKDTLVKTVKLTAGAPLHTGTSLVTQGVYNGTVTYKHSAQQTVSFYAKYAGDTKFTGSTSTTVATS